MNSHTRIDTNILDTIWVIFMVIVVGVGFMGSIALIMTEVETYESIRTNHLQIVEQKVFD